MTVKRIMLITCGVVALVILTTTSTEACSCLMSPTAACEVYGQYDVALVGRIVEAGDRGGDAKIRINRAVKGAKAGVIEVMRNQDAGSFCGYNFQVGVDYIILASRDEHGEIVIGGCTRTVWYSQTPGYSDALRFLDSLDKPPQGGWLFGTVEHFEPYRLDGDRNRSVEGATISITGPVNRSMRLEKGRYDFTGLPPGAYTVHADVLPPHPAATSLRGPDQSPDDDRDPTRNGPSASRHVTIAHNRDCAFSPFEVWADGRLSGTVVDAEGKPVTKIRVAVAHAAGDGQLTQYIDQASTETDMQGRYEIERLSEGTYVVGINLRDAIGRHAPYRRTVVPDPSGVAPGAFALRVSEHRELPLLKLDWPISLRRLSGVVFAGDKPVAHALVLLKETTTDEIRLAARDTLADENGRFTFDVLEGRSYIVEGEQRDRAAEFKVIARGATQISIAGDRNDVRVDVVPIK